MRRIETRREDGRETAQHGDRAGCGQGGEHGVEFARRLREDGLRYAVAASGRGDHQRREARIGGGVGRRDPALDRVELRSDMGAEIGVEPRRRRLAAVQPAGEVRQGAATDPGAAALVSDGEAPAAAAPHLAGLAQGIGRHAGADGENGAGPTRMGAEQRGEPVRDDSDLGAAERVAVAQFRLPLRAAASGQSAEQAQAGRHGAAEGFPERRSDAGPAPLDAERQARRAAGPLSDHAAVGGDGAEPGPRSASVDEDARARLAHGFARLLVHGRSLGFRDGIGKPAARPRHGFSGGVFAARIAAGRTGGIDSTDYLSALDPWAALPPEDMERLGAEAVRREFPDGTLLFDAGEMPEGVFVVSDGQVRVTSDDGGVLAELGPGNAVGGRRLLRGEPNTVRARAIADSVAFVVPADLFRHLAGRHAAIREFFRLGGREAARPKSLAALPVSDLMTPDPLAASPDTTIAEAARKMREARVSSILVRGEGGLRGILTVRDISARVVAEGLDPAGSLAGAMTADPVALPPGAAGSDVLHLMMERGISHVPIVEDGRILGIVSKTDLTRYQAESSGAVIGDVSGAPGAAALARVTDRIPALLAQLVGQGNRHEAVTRLVTDVADAVTRRLLVLAEEDLGAPPVPYLWAACGSQGRQEQTGVSDQDNVLVLSDAAREEHDDYFAALARFVSDGLDGCGYYYCPGDMMATNPRWRQPVSRWHDYFRGWIDRPMPEAQMLASVMFDLRPIGGDRTLFEGLHAVTLRYAAKNSIFAAHMTSNALTHQPPLGFFRGLATVHSGEHRDTIDMKHSGVIPVVDLARLYAIRGALAPVNTRARLEAALGAREVSPKGGRDLIDAYDVIADARLAHQAAQIRAGGKPDNFMAPGRLSSFERSHLRDAFLVVRTMQSAAGQRRGVL